HFECSRNDAGGNDAADTVGGIVDGIEYAQQCPHRFGVAGEPDPYLGNNAEGAFGADDDAGQIKTGSFDRPTDLDDGTIGHHQFQAEDVIDSNAILERVWSTGVGRDVATDGAGPLAAGV